MNIKKYFFDYSGRMSRREFWPRFIVGHVLLCFLFVLLFTIALTGLAKYQQSNPDEVYGYTQELNLDGDNTWLSQLLYPEYQLAPGERLQIKKECKELDGKAVYTTTSTLSKDGQQDVVSVSHEPFKNEFLAFFEGIPLLNQMDLITLLIMLGVGIILGAVLSLILLRYSILRLRDAGFSPWLMLLYLGHGLGALVLLVLFCFPTKREGVAGIAVA